MLCPELCNMIESGEPIRDIRRKFNSVMPTVSHCHVISVRRQLLSVAMEHTHTELTVNLLADRRLRIKDIYNADAPTPCYKVLKMLQAAAARARSKGDDVQLKIIYMLTSMEITDNRKG